MTEQHSNASRERRLEVLSKDLPLSCPMPSNTSWDAHPRVFLDIKKTGEILCPYCGILYVLTDDNV